MKITYMLEPLERKTLVKAVALQTELKAVYLGMPSAAYQIGGWRIDKAGTVTGPDNRELIATLRDRHSFVPMSEEYNTPTEGADPEAEALQSQPDRLTIEVPIDGNFTSAKLANLEKLIASRETLLKKVLGTDALPVEQTESSLKFRWFPVDGNAEVYNQLASALVRTSMGIMLSASKVPRIAQQFGLDTSANTTLQLTSRQNPISAGDTSDGIVR